MSHIRFVRLLTATALIACLPTAAKASCYEQVKLRFVDGACREVETLVAGQSLRVAVLEHYACCGVACADHPEAWGCDRPGVEWSTVGCEPESKEPWVVKVNDTVVPGALVETGDRCDNAPVMRFTGELTPGAKHTLSWSWHAQSIDVAADWEPSTGCSIAGSQPVLGGLLFFGLAILLIRRLAVRCDQ
jgi:hypothetical protein